MTIGGNLQLINQICAKSGLQGKDLENLRTNLQNLSKQELEAELVSLLVSGKDDSNKGLQVEQSASAVLLENYQKTYYYDKKGNIIIEYKDGDYVIERIIKGKDEEGNEIETTITYRNNRPRTKVVNKNGQREEVTSFTYNDKSDTNFIPSVTVETTKADNTVVKSEVLEINGYNGDFDLTKVTERETTKPDGTVTNITKILNILIETQKRPDGTVLTTYYNGTDIEACDNNQLYKVRQTVKRQGQEGKELCFDGEGNTIVTVNAGDGWERLARRFHTTEKKLKELNPKIKNLKAGQDILIPNEFDIESKEIGKVQPREEAFVQAWNAEVDRQIAQKVTENISNQDSQELKKAGVKPTSENYIFYQKFSQLNPSQKQNVLSMIKYYKAQGVTGLNEIKTKILETYPDVNLFDSGKLIRFYQNNNMGIGYIDRFNPQQKGPIALETFITDILKLNLKTEPGKTVYERMASIPQDKLDNFNASNIGAMTGSSFENIANCFLIAGINIFTESEYQLEMRMRTSRKTETEKESEIRAKTVDFAYQLVHKARLQLDAYLAEIKDHYIKNFGTIVWEGLKAIPTMLLPDSWTSGSGEYEALVKNISVKSANLYVLEGDILRLKSNVNSADFETQYKKLLKTDYSPEKINNLMTLAQNQPDKNSPDYAVYEKQMEKAIKDVTGKDFTKNVCSFINWSKGAGSLVETAIFCYITAGMGSTISIGGKTVKAVTVAGKTFTTATASGAAMVMARNFGKYAFYRASLNFIDDVDNLLAPMTLEEMLRGRKDVTLGGMFIGENNADQVRGCLSAVKDWATGKITRDQADEIIKKSFKNLSFDDFVSSNGGQVVLNTITSSIFGAAAGAASPLFFKAGEIGTQWGQKLGLNAPNIQQITADLLAKNPAGINAAEFMAKTYEALHATNIVGKGLQFLVETAVFYCTNLPLSLIQETLSESNGELEQAIKEDRLGSYLIGRFGDEALNLLKVKSIGTIIAMMMGTTASAQIKENFEDYDVLKNTTIRYEDATIQNPDGTFTSGKAVVLDGPTGKLYVDGSSAKFYTAQGQLVVNENLGAQAQFMEMNEGVKTTFLLGKFMQIERYVKSLQNPVEDAVDLSMPYKPSSQEQQVQIAIDQISGQKSQQPASAPQAIINPVANQPTGNNNGTPAVEIPINQPVKNPYEKPSMTVIDLGPQQMVAASSPQQTTEQRVTQTITATPLTDEQKTDLHERLQKIAQAYADNNYANIDILRNLNNEERKEFVDNILHLGSGKIHDDYDFLFFANGEKPAVLLGGLNETPEPYLDKLKSDNIDIFNRVVTFGNGQKRNNTILINKQMAKSIIQDNKELFQKRLGLNETSTVDEIYEKLISDNSILKDSDDSSDLTGLILGYPKYNTMIFRLDKWILDNNVMTARELRINVDIEKYKSALRQALQAEDSPYKNMSAEFKNTLLAKINEIKEVTPSRILFNNDSDGYVFNYTTPEPTELVRIEQSMVRTADKMADDGRVRVDARKETPQTSADKGIGRVRVNAPQDIGIPEATGVIGQNSDNNPYNLTQINTPQEAGEIANKALANSKHRIATAGYSQNSPEGYEETAKTFLSELENQLGDGNTAYVTSPTTGKGSIDAITTEVEGLGDNSIFYTTAQNYLSYISSDNTDIDTQAMQQVPKYVLPDTASYSQATAAASNTFIAIGGKNTTVSDFVNAIKYGNKAVILDSAILDTPAWDSENGTVGNASKYISEQIQAVKDGKPLPYPEIEGFTKQFIEENMDKLNSTVKIIQTDGTPSSLKIAAQQTALFLNEENQSLETNDGRVRINAPQASAEEETGRVRINAPQDVEVPQDVNVPAKPTENTMVHDSYVQVIMYPIKRIIEKFGNDLDLDKLEQTLKSLPLEALKNIADKRSGDEVDWDGLTKEKISEIQDVLKENGFNDDIHLLMFLYANGDADVKIQRLKDRKDVLPAGLSKEEFTQWIKIMNMYDGEYNFYLHNSTRQEEPISQEKPDWQSFKQDRTAVTQVLLNEIKDKNEYENFKTRKGYETDEDAIIPYINQYRKTHPEFKLSDNAKKAMDDFVKKYDTEQFMSNAEIDFEYITNYKQTSYRYNSKHEMAYHSLTNKIFDIRRKFNLDEDENFDLDKLHEKLENLPTETIDDLRRMFEATRISTKEDALRILNMDFANIDIAGIKSMLEDNDCFSYFTLADFAFSTPEEFVIKHQKLLARKNDLPSNCDYENQRQAWTQIMDMSDEDYNYYRSMQGSYPEGMDIKDLPIYRRLMQEAPEFTNELVGMKKKKYDFFGDEVPRFTLDEIAQLYEVTKTDKEFTMELINRHREKGGLTTGYIYNKSSDIIKIVELTKTFNKEDVKNLALKTIYCDANAIETLLKLKQSDPELYETFITNVYSIDDLEILKDCLEKNQPLTKELMQDKTLSVKNIKAIVDCNKKYFSIAAALFEQIDKYHTGNKEDRFNNYKKAEYSQYALECSDEQREVFEELLNAKNPDGTYRYNNEIIDLCELYEKDSKTFEALASLKLTEPNDGRVFYATEDIITEMFECYKEDKETTLQIIKNYPDLLAHNMKLLYDLLKTEDRETVIELISMRNETDTGRRFDVKDIAKLVQLKKENPQEFEEMINAKTLQNGQPVYAYDAGTIEAYINSSHNNSQDYINYLKSLTTTDKDGNEYKLLNGQQLADINVVYNIISSEPVGDIDMFNEIIYNPKYKFLLQILNHETAPCIGNWKVLDILDKYGIENTKGISISKQESDGQRLIVLETESGRKTINLKLDKENNVSILGEESSKTQGDKNIIRRNFDDGSYLVEEISYKEQENGEKQKIKVPFSTKKTWYDSNGVQTRSEVMTPVEGVPGEYTINVYERGLNQQMIKHNVGSVKFEENDEGSIRRIEKTLTSPDGTVTKQTKTTEEDGSVSTTYEITGVENGENKVLFSQRRSRVKLDENHYTSSLNGQIYDTKYSEDSITVSKLDDEGNISETITIGPDIIDPRLMPLFKQLPGDVFFLIDKIGIKRIFLDENLDKNAQYINKTIRISPYLMDNPFTLMHELYHGVSDLMFNRVSQNQDFNNTYDKDLANYQSQSSNANEQIIDYFSTRYHGNVEGREETFAEIGAIASCLDETKEGNDILGMRTIVAQQNMARTIAKEMSMVEEGMTKPLPERPPMTSTGITMITSPDGNPISHLNGTEEDNSMVRVNAPQDTNAPDITANLSQKQLDIYNLLQRDLKNFGDFDDELKIKIVKILDKYSSPENKQLSNLFKGILAYAGEPDLIEKICDNDMLLSEINKNAQTVVKLFAQHRNIDKDIRSIVYFNLLLMRYFYPENYSNLTHSKGYQQIMTGGLSIAILKDLKYYDNIDAEYFYNLFDKLEHTAEQTVSNSDELKQYPENHIKSAIELDPSRQDEILGWIKNAKNPTLMAQTLQIVNNTRARFNRNIDYAENQGNYVNPNELKQENNYLIDFIKIVSENPEMASILGRFCSYKEISLFNSKLSQANLDESTQDTLLTLFAANPDKLNGQVAINLVEFVSKAPNKIDLIRKILEKGDSQWLTFISENNADYIEDKMDNSEYGSITFIQTLMLTLAKDMPEMKDKNNWQRIEDCAYLLLEDVMNEYYTGYDKIREEYKPKINSAENPQKRRRFNNEFAGRINTLRTTIRNKIRFMSGVLDMYVNSPEKYEQVKDSGFLDMVKEGKLNPIALIMLNKNSNLSDNLYSDLEAVKSGKSIVPEFPDGTPLDTVFKETKTGDAVEVGNKMYINDGKQLVEWQMSKEMFLKLFPPVERYTTIQGALGDCYLVSSMTSIMNNPKSRVELYKSFKLVGNDVVVTIKSYEDFKGSKTFPNGNITVDMNNKHLIGCLGLMMLEQTYAQVSLREPYFDYLPSLNENTTPYSLMQRLQGGYGNDAMSELLGLTNLGSMPIPAEYNVPKKSSISFKITDRNTDSDKVKNYLAKYAGKENFILNFGTIPKEKEAVESILLKEYNIVSSHGYNIVGYDAATETVKITNPHNASVVTEIPFSELIKYMSNLIITNLNE